MESRYESITFKYAHHQNHALRMRLQHLTKVLEQDKAKLHDRSEKKKHRIKEELNHIRSIKLPPLATLVRLQESRRKNVIDVCINIVKCYLKRQEKNREEWLSRMHIGELRRRPVQTPDHFDFIQSAFPEVFESKDNFEGFAPRMTKLDATADIYDGNHAAHNMKCMSTKVKPAGAYPECKPINIRKWGKERKMIDYRTKPRSLSDYTLSPPKAAESWPADEGMVAEHEDQKAEITEKQPPSTGHSPRPVDNNPSRLSSKPSSNWSSCHSDTIQPHQVESEPFEQGHNFITNTNFNFNNNNRPLTVNVQGRKVALPSVPQIHGNKQIVNVPDIGTLEFDSIGRFTLYSSIDRRSAILSSSVDDAPISYCESRCDKIGHEKPKIRNKLNNKLDPIVYSPRRSKKSIR